MKTTRLLLLSLSLLATVPASFAGDRVVSLGRAGYRTVQDSRETTVAVYSGERRSAQDAVRDDRSRDARAYAAGRAGFVSRAAH